MSELRKAQPKTDRKLISQPVDWWQAWQDAAKDAGLPLSEWIGDQCRKGLPREVRTQLSERRRRGKPRKDERSK